MRPRINPPVRIRKVTRRAAKPSGSKVGRTWTALRKKLADAGTATAQWVKGVRTTVSTKVRVVKMKLGKVRPVPAQVLARLRQALKTRWAVMPILIFALLFWGYITLERITSSEILEKGVNPIEIWAHKHWVQYCVLGAAIVAIVMFFGGAMELRRRSREALQKTLRRVKTPKLILIGVFLIAATVIGFSILKLFLWISSKFISATPEKADGLPLIVVVIGACLVLGGISGPIVYVIKLASRDTHDDVSPKKDKTKSTGTAEKKGWRKLVSDLWARIRLALVIAILALAGLSTLFYFYVPGFTDNLTRNVFWLFLLGLFFGLYLSWRKDEGAFRGIAILMGVIALLIIYPIGRRIAENEIKAWREKQEREAQADKERESGMAQVPSSTEILVLEPGKPSHRIPLEGWRLGIGYTYSMGPLLWQKNCMGEWLDYDPNMEFAGDVYSIRFKAPDAMDLPIEKAPF